MGDFFEYVLPTRYRPIALYISYRAIVLFFKIPFVTFPIFLLSDTQRIGITALVGFWLPAVIAVSGEIAWFLPPDRRGMIEWFRRRSLALSAETFFLFWISLSFRSAPMESLVLAGSIVAMETCMNGKYGKWARLAIQAPIIAYMSAVLFLLSSGGFVGPWS